jgi:transposase-like protein
VWQGASFEWLLGQSHGKGEATMPHPKVIEAHEQTEVQAARSVLDEVIRDGARRMLQHALEEEVRAYLERYATECDEQGRRLVVGNGSLPERTLVTGAGPLAIQQPRVRDRRMGHAFTSAILPPYMRRTPSIDALIPALYLKGVSTGDFSEALAAIIGPEAAGVSASTIVRLKEQWSEDYKVWAKRDLSEKHYVYLWADGIHFNVRLEDERICMLVLMGATADGTKELVAVWDGFRESSSSWQEVLRDLKKRGLAKPPALAIGDGALGFWAALREVFPTTKWQRCWVHKTANVLDKLPKKLQPHAKGLLHEMYLAATKDDALASYQEFLRLYQTKYPRAAECLEKDFEALFTFYDFPAEHWSHIRTSNPIESTFATVRLRHRRTKGSGSTTATLMMVYKLASEAEKHWRRLNGPNRIAQVLEGARFINGILEGEMAA